MTNEKTPAPETSIEGQSADAVPAPERTIVERLGTANRGELSAQALGRMLGLATASDISILDGKVDLLASKVNQLIVKMEKIQGVIMKVPTGTDLERIDIQIGALKAAMLEFVNQHRETQDGARTAAGNLGSEKAAGADPSQGPKKQVTTSSVNP